MQCCLSGGIGRRTGLKILRDLTLVSVQVRPQAPNIILEEYPSLVEGTGLENQEVAKVAQGFESLFLRHICLLILSRDGAARQLVGLITQRSLVQIQLPQPMVPWCSGYHVCLSRRRSRVQLPSEPPFILASQLSRQSRGLKILVSLVQFPLEPPDERNKSLVIRIFILHKKMQLKKLHLLFIQKKQSNNYTLLQNSTINDSLISAFNSLLSGYLT